MAYYFPIPNETYTFVELFVYTNTLTGDIFGYLLLIAIFAISFISMSKFETSKAFASSMFLTTMSSYLLTLLGVVSSGAMIWCTVLLLASVFVLYKS